MAHDRRSHPEQRVARGDAALVLSPSRVWLSALATSAATVATLGSLLAGDPLGAALNLALLTVFFAD